MTRDLARAATILHETGVKRDAYESRGAIKERLRQLFQDDGPLWRYASIWDGQLAPLIDERPSSLPQDERLLLLASDIARSATTLSRSVLSETGLLPERTRARPGTVSKSFSDYVDEYNEAIDSARADNLSYDMPQGLILDAAGTDPRRLLSAVARAVEDTRTTVLQIFADRAHPARQQEFDVVERDVALLLWDVVDSSSQDVAMGAGALIALDHRLQQELSVRAAQRVHPQSRDIDDSDGVVAQNVEDAIHIFRVVSETLGAHGLSVRGAIESTVDGEKLLRNRRTLQVTGRPYHVASRVRDAFKDLQQADSIPKFSSPAGDDLPYAEPAGSYLLLTEKAGRVLRELEAEEIPQDLSMVGIIEGLEIRARSVLPRTVEVYSHTSAG